MVAVVANKDSEAVLCIRLFSNRYGIDRQARVQPPVVRRYIKNAEPAIVVAVRSLKARMLQSFQNSAVTMMQVGEG